MKVNKESEIIAKIKAIMKRESITIASLGITSGIHPNNLTRLLNGRQSPNLKTIVIVCNCLNLSIEIEEQYETIINGKTIKGSYNALSKKVLTAGSACSEIKRCIKINN